MQAVKVGGQERAYDSNMPMKRVPQQVSSLQAALEGVDAAVMPTHI